MTLVLIADIGGTNARFALADQAGIRDVRILPVADYAGPVEAVEAYLKPLNQKPTSAVFAMAGPVTGDHFELTNFPWSFSTANVRDRLKLSVLTLINDFHAMALGVLDADKNGITQIGGGAPQVHGNIGVIGPGTGLGVASLVWDGKRYIAVPGEGGHVTVPSVGAREHAIIDWLLQNRYHHISAERVCSGKGMINLYDAIGALNGTALPELSPEEITLHAQDGSSSVCAEVLTLMMGFLGRIAGNLALTTNASGGVYFTGGILPKIGMPYIEASRLRADFIAKGRQSSFVDRMPTYIVNDPILALRGLHHYAVYA